MQQKNHAASRMPIHDGTERQVFSEDLRQSLGRRGGMVDLQDEICKHQVGYVPHRAALRCQCGPGFH